MKSTPYPDDTSRSLRSAMRVLALTLAMFCNAAFAQSANEVVVTLKAQKVQRGPDGKEVLKLADRAMPGEIIQYDALYKNQGRKGIRKLEPTLPIPQGLEYLPGSASPAPAKASLDGKNFAPVPLKRQVALPDGQLKEELVPYSQYRALRWEVGDLEAGRTAVISARAVLALN